MLIAIIYQLRIPMLSARNKLSQRACCDILSLFWSTVSAEIGLLRPVPLWSRYKIYVFLLSEMFPISISEEEC